MEIVQFFHQVKHSSTVIPESMVCIQVETLPRPIMGTERGFYETKVTLIT